MHRRKFASIKVTQLPLNTATESLHHLELTAKTGCYTHAHYRDATRVLTKYRLVDLRSAAKTVTQHAATPLRMPLAQRSAMTVKSEETTCAVLRSTSIHNSGLILKSTGRSNQTGWTCTSAGRPKARQASSLNA